VKKTEFLKDILKEKEEESALLEKKGEKYFREKINILPAVKSLSAALTAPGISIIAEVKKASPSHGMIVPDYNPAETARQYQDCGASAISVLTCRKYFSGSLGDLAAVRKSVDLPLLRKDFIIHPLQIYESRIEGADAVLLIVSILEKSQLGILYKTALENGLEVLIEVHDEKELETALELRPKMIGINSRNLKTLEVDKRIFGKLIERIPRELLAVAESGIENQEEISDLKKTGFHAILIGYTLLKSGPGLRSRFSGLRGGQSGRS